MGFSQMLHMGANFLEGREPTPETLSPGPQKLAVGAGRLRFTSGAISDALPGDGTWSHGHKRLFLPGRSRWRDLCNQTWLPRV